MQTNGTDSGCAQVVLQALPEHDGRGACEDSAASGTGAAPHLKPGSGCGGIGAP